VGTERSFIGAALAPRTTHLLIVDYDSRVVAFCRTNIALLEAATSREEYLKLRLTSSHDEWRAAAAKAKGLEPYLLPFLEQRASFDAFRESLKLKGFVPLHDPRFAQLNGEFRDGNYLYDEALFRRISRLARAGRIQAEALDLTKAAQVRALVADLTAEKLKVSVLDLSNCWMEPYVPSPAFEDSLSVFASAAAADGLLLLTDFVAPPQAQRLKEPSFQYHSEFMWDYIGFRLAPFASLEASQRFARALKSPRPSGTPAGFAPGQINASQPPMRQQAPLLDGRLFGRPHP
jgi:hypothetical protein